MDDKPSNNIIPFTPPDDGAVNAPFVPLGYDHGEYYYLAAGTGQLIRLQAAHHTVTYLLQLAPLDFWRMNFGSEGKVNYNAAANELFRMQEKTGPFDPSRLRGRGPWWHDGRVVLHLGDRIILGAEHGHITEVKPSNMPGNYIYERAVPIHFTAAAPLAAPESAEFLRFLELLSWQKPISAKYVAGWCACALIGGALVWRPHLWMTGAAGSGKTWAITMVVRTVLGKNCRFFLSSTSEAGIRQTLRRDSLPVVFDEAEGEDQRARDRLQNILALVRQSSSDTQGTIAKGTPSGDPNTYDIRSCFAFSSINASLVQSSDHSRVTVCEMTKNHKFTLTELEEMHARLLTPEWVERFYARMVRLVPVIRHNARIFGSAVRAVLHEQRAGDQMGTLLAGAYAVEHDGLITEAQAQAWVEEHKQDWEETRQEIEGMADEHMLFNHLMQQTIRNGTIEKVVGRWVDEVIEEPSTENNELHQKNTHRLLMMHGFRVISLAGDVKALAISNTHASIKKMVSNTPWAVRWGKVLARIEGATVSEAAVYFGSQGSHSRAVLIPLKMEE